MVGYTSRNADAKLVHGTIHGHLIRQTMPMLVGVASLMSVGLLDAYFVGQEGADPLAAISFIFPVTMALASLGVGIIVGINSVVARALGAGDRARAETRGVQGIALAAVISLVVTSLLLAGRQALFRLMNAPDDLLPLIDAYMLPYALGLPLLLLTMSLNGILRGQGAAARSSAILIAMAAVNWILDPVLIAGWGPAPGYGIAGAAYATVSSWSVAGVVALILTQTSKLPVRPACLRGANWRQGARALARVGAPAAVTNAINPIGLSILTAILATLGQNQVAGFGAAGRLQTFAVVPLLALSSSIGAIVGQNWGAHEQHRARLALLQACGFSLGYGLAVAALLFFLRGFFAGLFTDTAAVQREIESYLFIAVWGYGLYGVLIVSNGAMNAIDRAPTAFLVSIGRVLLIMVPAAWLGAGTAGAPGVYGAELAANLLGGTAAFLLCLRLLRR